MEVIFGESVQHAHKHTYTQPPALIQHAHKHTHTQTPALILHPKKNGHIRWVKEPDLIFLPVSVLGHP